MPSREVRRSGARSRSDGRLEWRLWAPRAQTVELVRIHGADRRAVPMTRERYGFSAPVAADVAKGERYTIRLDGGPERPDPASLWQPDGPFGASAIVRPERFTWTDQNWKGVRREDLVFYELHVGAFTPQGTFDAM